MSVGSQPVHPTKGATRTLAFSTIPVKPGRKVIGTWLNPELVDLNWVFSGEVDLDGSDVGFVAGRYPIRSMPRSRKLP